MAYNRKDLRQGETYDSNFHSSYYDHRTKPNTTNLTTTNPTTTNPTKNDRTPNHHNNRTNDRGKNMKNDQILSYRMFTGPFELNNPNTNNNNNIIQDRKPVQSFESPITEFNRTIDNLHLPQDMQRPIATRDQVKEYYENDNDHQHIKQKRANDYFNQHQFMPSRLGNKSMTGFDMYSMSNEKKNGYQDFF